jgi:hypothetical protein
MITKCAQPREAGSRPEHGAGVAEADQRNWWGIRVVQAGKSVGGTGAKRRRAGRVGRAAGPAGLAESPGGRRGR